MLACFYMYNIPYIYIFIYFSFWSIRSNVPWANNGRGDARFVTTCTTIFRRIQWDPATAGYREKIQEKRPQVLMAKATMSSLLRQIRSLYFSFFPSCNRRPFLVYKSSSMAHSSSSIQNAPSRGESASSPPFDEFACLTTPGKWLYRSGTSSWLTQIERACRAAEGSFFFLFLFKLLSFFLYTAKRL